MNLHRPFIVPPPIATAMLTMRDGAQIRLRRYGRPGATRLVLSHGNGLAINAYAPFWLPLAEDHDIVVFDMRNHGENPLHEEEGHHWESFYSDMEEIFWGISRHFGPSISVGVFHSLSSIAALIHTLRYGKRWDGLCVFDPPMMPPRTHPLFEAEDADMERHSARAFRRIAFYESPEQLAAQFRRRASFAGWIPEGADLLARSTLRPLPDGRWVLCCPPAFEARVFRENKDETLFERLPDIPMPLIIIAADPASVHASPAAAVAKAAHDDLGIEYAMVPGTTHFLQIEEPQACRNLLTDFLRRKNLDANSIEGGQGHSTS